MIDSRADFFGFDPERDDRSEHVRTKKDFAAVRERLQAGSSGTVVVDDVGGDIAGTWVVFDSSSVTVVAEMMVEDAYEAESQTDFQHVQMGHGALFAADGPLTPVCT